MKNYINPLAIFISEHADLLVHLLKLNSVTKSIKKNGLSKKSLDIIAHVMATLEYEIGHHNKLEEDALFPILEKHVEGPTQLLKDEHKQMFISFAKLYKVFNKVNKAKINTKKDVELLTTSTQEVVHIFVNHIHKENYILFPLLKRFLTKEELHKIAEKMI